MGIERYDVIVKMPEQGRRKRKKGESASRKKPLRPPRLSGRKTKKRR